MRILILSQYFWPESFIINDLVKNLSEQGHTVTVATGKPNYPGGKIFNGYYAWGIQRERYCEHVEVIRVPMMPRKVGGAKNLISNYVSFVISGLLLFPWLLRKHTFDSIVVFAPSPIVQAIPAIPLKWLHKAQLAIWVQDLWPESLIGTGFVTNRFLLRMIGLLVRGIYFFSDILLVQSQAFIESVAKYGSRKKIIYYPNSFQINTGIIGKSEIGVPENLLHKIRANFSVVFAGNIGTAQSIETIVEAAQYLQDRTDVRIFIVGSGSQSTWLEETVAHLRIKNIEIVGRYPMECMNQIFSASRVLMVTLKNDPVFKVTIPSKVQAYLAAGKPIIAALDGEGARILRESGAAFVCKSGDAATLASLIRQAAEMEKSQLEGMGIKGRQYFDTNFEMSEQVRALIKLLKQDDGNRGLC